MTALTSNPLFAENYPLERLELENFYKETHGSNWIRQDNWLSDSIPYCEWHGVICDKNGHVTELQLYDNGLEGSLPDTLCNLTELKTLYLSFNHIGDLSLRRLVNVKT